MAVPLRSLNAGDGSVVVVRISGWEVGAALSASQLDLVLALTILRAADALAQLSEVFLNPSDA